MISDSYLLEVVAMASLTVANLAMGVYDSIGLFWSQVINDNPLLRTGVFSHGQAGFGLRIEPLSQTKVAIAMTR